MLLICYGTVYKLSLLLNDTHTTQGTLWCVSELNYRVSLGINMVQGFYCLQYIPRLPSSRRWLPSVGSKLNNLDNNLDLVPLSQQPNPIAQSVVLDQWIKLILSYARYRKQFVIRVEDAEVAGSDWDEILRNERIDRVSKVSFLLHRSEANVSQIECCRHISLLSLPRWFNVISLYMSHQDKPGRCYYIGAHPKNGQMFSITGYA